MTRALTDSPGPARRPAVEGLAGSVQSLQREIGTQRSMIGSGFTLLGVLLAVATFVLGGS